MRITPFAVAAIFIVGTYACSPTLAPAQENTNPFEIQKWFKDLTNRMGGSCCAEADGYPAVVLKMPTVHDAQGRPSYIQDGEALITDPSAKDIYVAGVLIKTRPAITGDLHVHFSWMEMAKEVHGNPFDNAYVFVRTDGVRITAVYCVVIVPQGV